tara:strand:+ start:365 stop:919 length:555 start_codon:yes stop_codon:yes gene_type:complete
MEKITEQLCVSEYIYPLADKVNPILRPFIKKLIQKNKLFITDPHKPRQITAKMTGWHITSREIEQVISWASSLIIRDFEKANGHLLKCSEVWGIVFNKGDSIEGHTHVPSVYSFVYYVDAPKGSSSLVFETSGHRIEAEKGKMIIFDSRLTHKVTPNSSKNRCALSGNFINKDNTGAYQVPGNY